MLRRSNPEMFPNPSSVPRNPPTTAPMIPSMIVATIRLGVPRHQVLGDGPGYESEHCHNRIPIVHLRKRVVHAR